MKKYLGFIIAVLVGIGVMSISTDVHAMTKKDLAGKVYEVQVVNSYDSNNSVVQQAQETDAEMGPENYYLFFGKNGRCLTLNKEGNDKKVQKMLRNKKYAISQIKKYGIKYSIDDNKLNIYESNAAVEPSEDEDDLFAIDSESCEDIQQTDNNGFTIHENPSRGLQNLGVTGTDYEFLLSPQQYKFKW